MHHERGAALVAAMRKEWVGGYPHDRTCAIGAAGVPPSGGWGRPRGGPQGAQHHLLGPTAALSHPRRRAKRGVREGGRSRHADRTRLGRAATAHVMACGRYGRARPIPASAPRAGRCGSATQLLHCRALGRGFLSQVRELTLRGITRRTERERFLPRLGGRMGPRNEARSATEFVSSIQAPGGRQRGRRGRRGGVRSYVPTTAAARYAPGPNGAAWGRPGGGGFARNARQGGLNDAER